MLSHRTNVLLDPEDYQILAQIAQKKNESVGSLLRTAAQKVYRIQEKKKKQRKNLLAEIKKLNKTYDNLNVTTQDILDWRHEGHRF